MVVVAGVLAWAASRDADQPDVGAEAQISIPPHTTGAFAREVYNLSGLQDMFETSEVVFEGTVLSVQRGAVATDEDSGDVIEELYIAQVRVDRPFKAVTAGSVVEIVKEDFWAPGRLVEGEQAAFFLISRTDTGTLTPIVMSGIVHYRQNVVTLYADQGPNDWALALNGMSREAFSHQLTSATRASEVGT